MATYAQYTGQRVQPLPSGYLAAETARARTMREGFDKAGEAIVAWGKSRGEEVAAEEKYDALRESFMSPGEKATYGTAFDKGKFDQAYDIAEMKDSILTEDRDKQARSILKIKMDEADAIEEEQNRVLDEKALQLNYALDQARLTTGQIEARGSHLFRPSHGAPWSWDFIKSGKPLPNPPANDSETKLLFAGRNLAKELMEQQNKEQEIQQSLGQLMFFHKPAPRAEREARGSRLFREYQAAISEPVKSSAHALQDEMLADPGKYAKQVEVSPATAPSLDPELAKRLGPGLHAKMESGEMSGGERALVMEIMEKYRGEQDYARSPQGQMAAAQLAAAQAQLAAIHKAEGREDALMDVPQKLAALGVEQRAEQQKVTPEWLMEQVQGGKMTAAEAIEREEAMVDYMRDQQFDPVTGLPKLPTTATEFDFRDERGKVPYVTGEELRILEQRKKDAPAAKHDAYFSDGWKYNEAFNKAYQGVPARVKADVWKSKEAEAFTLNWKSREDMMNEAQAAAAGTPLVQDVPQEMQQEVRRALTGTERREEAIRWVNKNGRKLGPKGYQAALAMVDVHFPKEASITTQEIPGTDAVFVLQGGKMLGQATKSKQMANIAWPITMLGPDGKQVSSGKLMWNNQVIDDPFAAGKREKPSSAEVAFEQNLVEYLNQIKLLRDTVNKYGTWESAYIGNAQASARLASLPYKLAILYAKVVDPNSVAREGEVEAAKKYVIPVGFFQNKEESLASIEEQIGEMQRRALLHQQATKRTVPGLDSAFGALGISGEGGAPAPQVKGAGSLKNTNKALEELRKKNKK